MRLGGIATGLDTDTLVKQMMTPYQMRADKVKQEKVLLEYKQNLYRNVASDMKNIYTKYFDIGSTANKGTNLILSGNYDTVKFTSTDDSVVSARGLAGAKIGNYQVSVEQKAEPSSLTLAGDKLKGESFVLEIAGEKLEVSLKDKDGKSIEGNNKAITENINKAIEAHNKKDSAKKIEVNVTTSELAGNIRIEGKKTGEENNIKMNAYIGAKIEADADGKPTIVGQTETIGSVDSKDSIVTISDAYGNTKEVKHASNKFTIDNVEYTINGVSEKDENNKMKPTKLKGTADSSKIVENVKAFVDDYNKLIDKMNSLTTEKRNRDFMPLTDEQKKEMSETEIKLWEEKTKKGLLRNDDILTGAVNELLGHISSGMGEGLNLKDFGISTNPDYRTQKGKIVLDEDKLTAALEGNGEETRKALTGMFNKMKDTFNDTAISSGSKLSKRAGAKEGVTAFNNELSKKMDVQQREYDKMIKSLAKRESRYYTEFSRLEVAMNKANAQMSQFMSMGQ